MTFYPGVFRIRQKMKWKGVKNVFQKTSLKECATPAERPVISQNHVQIKKEGVS